MAVYTFLDVAKDTIAESKIPLSETEMWEKALEMGLDKKLNSTGKTPWKTISARIYVDIRDNENTEFMKVGKRPTKFYLKELYAQENPQDIQKKVEAAEKKETTEKLKLKERELPPFLVKYLNEDIHFKAFSKTIYHESSSRRTKGMNKWLHPDVVSVYFPFQDYEAHTTSLQKALNSSRVKLFSFEIKTYVDFSNLREYYFQAVSNSSWAHEGYLVCHSIASDADLLDELRRLNNSFGIGIIKLDTKEVAQSEVLLPAKESTELNWDTIDRLASENQDFRDFMESIKEDIQLGKVKNKEDYDKILDDENLQKVYHLKIGI